MHQDLSVKDDDYLVQADYSIPFSCSVSLFRIVDLIVMGVMGFLSLVISSVLTDGLARTCNAVPDDGRYYFSATSYPVKGAIMT